MTKNKIPVEKWGRDHWSLLAYLETLCVDSCDGDGIGQINFQRVRLKDRIGQIWNKSYGTRLHKSQIPMHDDINCLEDIEKAGFVEVVRWLMDS